MKGQFEDVISYLLGQHEVADKLKDVSSNLTKPATASFAFKLTLENELRSKFTENGYNSDQQLEVFTKLVKLEKRIRPHTGEDHLEYLTVTTSMNLVAEGYAISADVLKLFNLLYKKYR